MTKATLGVVVWQIQITQMIASAPEQKWMTLPILEIAALPTLDSASALEITLMTLVKDALTLTGKATVFVMIKTIMADVILTEEIAAGTMWTQTFAPNVNA
jgi:hypothetical protein